ncbi:MAG: HEPN domain-containing protein [Thermomicrobia bacterium]|nr:HEPN domain-containing protein [Thermomicrobia bacterium]MCA1724000.1 HEPN domain-containing protein [Thermomicrobia bacterium]
MERARQSLADAEMLAQAGSWNSCVNRLYYACFYATSALIERDGATVKKHTGVRSFLNQCYVRTARIEQGLGDFYNGLFDTRLDGDYEDLIAFEDEKVRPLIVEARRFVASIESLLSQ